MARLARLAVAGHLHHVSQRGNNGQPVFLTDDDYALFLRLLEENAKRFKVAVHSYVLTPTQLQLLLTPSVDGDLSKMMQSIGRTYVRVFNNTHKRSGTLWEGRYRSAVVQAERYLIASMAHMDAEPLRAGCVDASVDYAWSSRSHYLGQTPIPWLVNHPIIWALGNTPFAREAAYLDQTQAICQAGDDAVFAREVQNGWVIGDEKFLANLQKSSVRRLQKLLPGRPKLSKAE